MPNWLTPYAFTMADMLKSAGYATAHFGKWHLGIRTSVDPIAPSPHEYGFDDNLRYANRQGISNRIVDATIKFIEGAKDRRFFANVWLYAAHTPLRPLPEDLAVYHDLAVSGNDFPDYQRAYVDNAKNPIDQMRTYCAVITELDRAIGRRSDYLDEKDLAQNTMVLFMTDNGPEDYVINGAANGGMGSPGPFRGRKRSLYEGGVRVPLIIRWPSGIRAGMINKHGVISAADLLPTLARLVRVPIWNSEFDGEDVLDIIYGASRPRRKPLMWEYRFRALGEPHNISPSLAIRRDDWKLLADPDSDRRELFNIADDPEERVNLADSHQSETEILLQELMAWRYDGYRL